MIFPNVKVNKKEATVYAIASYAFYSVNLLIVGFNCFSYSSEK